MKRVSDTTWAARPAIMMLTPVWDVAASSAVSAMAPPTAWRISEPRSQPMKMAV
jgi:hypothetical protein